MSRGVFACKQSDHPCGSMGELKKQPIVMPPPSISKLAASVLLPLADSVCYSSWNTRSGRSAF
jgi:hypothetical protein